MKLADLMERDAAELAALEALDNGKTFGWANSVDVPGSVQCIRYYGGWADKNQGKVVEVSIFLNSFFYLIPNRTLIERVPILRILSSFN